jgi:hypothetical protein
MHFRTCTFGSGRSNTVLTHEQDMRVVVICEYCHDACQPRRGRNKTPHTNNTDTRGRMPPASLPHSRCQPLLLLAPCIHPFPNFLHLFPCLHPFTTRGEGMELRGQDLHLVLLSLSRRVCDSILKARSSSSPSHILWWCRKTARERQRLAAASTKGGESSHWSCFVSAFACFIWRRLSLFSGIFCHIWLFFIPHSHLPFPQPHRHTHLSSLYSVFLLTGGSIGKQSESEQW